MTGRTAMAENMVIGGVDKQIPTIGIGATEPSLEKFLIILTGTNNRVRRLPVRNRCDGCSSSLPLCRRRGPACALAVVGPATTVGRCAAVPRENQILPNSRVFGDKRRVGTRRRARWWPWMRRELDGFADERRNRRERQRQNGLFIK